jgi:hypothetical protein
MGKEPQKSDIVWGKTKRAYLGKIWIVMKMVVENGKPKIVLDNGKIGQLHRQTKVDQAVFDTVTDHPDDF